MHHFPQGRVQDAGVVSKKRKRLPRRRRAAHFSQKTRKMLLLKSALKSKSKSKPWEMNLPDPLFFFTNKGYTFQAKCSFITPVQPIINPVRSTEWSPDPHHSTAPAPRGAEST
ncbi:MAG: hypothetical protein H7834_16725, partial [Magnetococcus sp. YQC-9]